MGTKSQSTKGARALLAVSKWVVRLDWLNWLFFGGLIALTVFAWRDPERITWAIERLKVHQIARAKDESRILREANAQPAMGRIELSFANLNFGLPAEAFERVTPRRGYFGSAPEGIKLYDGRQIRIKGFMLPTKVEKEGVRECLIMANQMACCFGRQPRFCDFIVARVSGKPLLNQPDRPVTFEGTLHVGDVFQGTYWTALYTMECTAAER